MRSPIPPNQQDDAYRRLWRVVDGAVADAFFNHPDYLAPRRRREAQLSIVKRVVGAVLGCAEKSAKGPVSHWADRSPASLEGGDDGGLLGLAMETVSTCRSQRGVSRNGHPA
jgi:hypothetical protein